MRVDLLQIVINLSESEIILRTFRSTLSCYSRYLENTWTDILEKNLEPKVWKLYGEVEWISILHNNCIAHYHSMGNVWQIRAFCQNPYH